MKKFKVIEVKEVTCKTGNKFIAYKTLTKGNRKIDLRFRKEIPSDQLPKEPCYIIVDDDKCNVDTTRLHPILWIKEIVAIEPFEYNNNIDDFFD